MDTTEAATRMGTTPRILRQFLRSPQSTFVAVGSGSRYEFDEADIPTLARRFSDWKAGGKAKTPKSKTPTPAPIRISPAARRSPSKRDQEVWSEEGPVRIEDIRQPRIRARVLHDARAAEDRLMMLLMSKGLHISQLGDQRKVSA